MNKKLPFILIAAVAAAFLVAILLFRQNPQVKNLPPEAKAKTSVQATPAAVQETDSVVASNLISLRQIARNPSMSATGATASYEMRLAIADRLNTNEAFLRWATNAVATAVFHLASSKDFHIHGADLANTNAMRIDVKATLSGLRGEASYDPDTNSRGPVQFIIEGGTNPIVTMVQDPYGMAGYQLNPKQAGSDTYPRDVARMDWSSATAPLDKAQIEDAARNAYLAMTGSPMPNGVQVNIDVPPVTDGTVRDPSIQISGNQGATVATVNNQRYPFADFEFINSETQARVFSGEMIQSAAGTGAFVELFTTQSRSGAQNSVIDLGQEFLSPSGDWQNEVLSKLGSTPQDQVLKRVWSIPNR